MYRVAIIAAAIVASAAANPVDAPVPKRFDAVKRGMSTDDVKHLLAPPQRTARLILCRKHLEQWHYDDPAGWVEFQSTRGEEPFVLSVHVEK